MQDKELFEKAKKTVDKIMNSYGHNKLYNYFNFKFGNGELGKRLSLEKEKIAKESQTSRQEVSSVEELIINLMNLYQKSLETRFSEQNRLKKGEEVAVSIVGEEHYRHEWIYDHDTIPHYDYSTFSCNLLVTAPQFKNQGTLEKKILESLEHLREIYYEKLTLNSQDILSTYRQIEKAKSIIYDAEQNIQKPHYVMHKTKDFTSVIRNEGFWNDLKNQKGDAKLETCRQEIAKENKKQEKLKIQLGENEADKKKIQETQSILEQYMGYLLSQEVLLKSKADYQKRLENPEVYVTQDIVSKNLTDFDNRLKDNISKHGELFARMKDHAELSSLKLFDGTTQEPISFYISLAKSKDKEIQKTLNSNWNRYSEIKNSLDLCEETVGLFTKFQELQGKEKITLKDKIIGTVTKAIEKLFNLNERNAAVLKME